MHHQNFLVVTRVKFVVFQQRDVKPPRVHAHMSRGFESCPVQTHAHVRVVDGMQSDKPGHPVQHIGRVAGQHVAAAATVGGVEVGRLHLNGNKVLVVLSNGPGALHEGAHEEVLIAAVVSVDALEVVHHVVRVGEDVIVAVEQEAHAGTALLHPLQEEDLLQRQVREGLLEVPLEDVAMLFVLHRHQLVQPLLLDAGARRPRHEDPANPGAFARPLLGPGIPQDLSPLKVLRRRLDGQQQEDVRGSVRPAAFVGKVEQQGEVFTVLVVHEVLEARGEVEEAGDVGHGQVLLTARRDEEGRSGDDGGRLLVTWDGFRGELKGIMVIEGWRRNMVVFPGTEQQQANGHHQEEACFSP